MTSPDPETAAIHAAAEAITNGWPGGGSPDEAVAWRLAKRALEAAEQAWPHQPPQRDPASTTAAHVERAPQFDYDRRRPASFGFGPPAT